MVRGFGALSTAQPAHRNGHQLILGCTQHTPKLWQPPGQGRDAGALFLLAQFPHERSELFFRTAWKGRSGYPAGTQDFHPSTSVRAGAVAMLRGQGKPKSHPCNVARAAIRGDKTAP